jgi:hypothetical protein
VEVLPASLDPAPLSHHLNHLHLILLMAVVCQMLLTLMVMVVDPIEAKSAPAKSH